MKKLYFTPDVQMETVDCADILTNSGLLAFQASYDGDEQSWDKVFSNTDAV